MKYKTIEELLAYVQGITDAAGTLNIAIKSNQLEVSGIKKVNDHILVGFNKQTWEKIYRSLERTSAEIKNVEYRKSLNEISNFICEILMRWDNVDNT